DVDAVVTALSQVRERTGVPVVAVRTGADHLAPDAAATMRAAGLPVYPTPARAVRALAALAQFAEERSVPAWAQSGATGLSTDQTGAGRALAGAATDEHALKQVLREAGLPVPLGRVVTDAQD